MTDFSALAARMDIAIINHLSDPAILDGEPVRGMFAAPWRQPSMGSMRTGLVESTLTLRDQDAVEATESSVVQVAGKTFEVVGVEPDGSGMTVLVLREALP